MRYSHWLWAAFPLTVLALLLLGSAAVEAGCASEPPGSEGIEGRLVAMASSVHAAPGQPPAPPAISFLIETADGLLNVDLTEATSVGDPDGRPLPPTSIPLGSRLLVVGERTGPTQIVATSITVLP